MEKMADMKSDTKLLLPVWIDELQSQSEFNKENYSNRIKKLISEQNENLAGIMIFGVSNISELSLVRKYDAYK